MIFFQDENNTQQNSDYLEEEIATKSIDYANAENELDTTGMYETTNLGSISLNVLLYSESEYKKIMLEDGTCAIIDHELWKSLLENVNKSATTSKKERKYPCMYAGCDKIYTAPHHLTVSIYILGTMIFIG